MKKNLTKFLVLSASLFSFHQIFAADVDHTQLKDGDIVSIEVNGKRINGIYRGIEEARGTAQYRNFAKVDWYIKDKGSQYKLINGTKIELNKLQTVDISKAKSEGHILIGAKPVEVKLNPDESAAVSGGGNIALDKKQVYKLLKQDSQYFGSEQMPAPKLQKQESQSVAFPQAPEVAAPKQAPRSVEVKQVPQTGAPRPEARVVESKPVLPVKVIDEKMVLSEKKKVIDDVRLKFIADSLADAGLSRRIPTEKLSEAEENNIRRKVLISVAGANTNLVSEKEIRNLNKKFSKMKPNFTLDKLDGSKPKTKEADIYFLQEVIRKYYIELRKSGMDEKSASTKLQGVLTESKRYDWHISKKVKGQDQGSQQSRLDYILRELAQEKLLAKQDSSEQKDIPKAAIRLLEAANARSRSSDHGQGISNRSGDKGAVGNSGSDSQVDSAENTRSKSSSSIQAK